MSDFVVSARKYRPKLFSNVIGQEHVTKTLKNALIKNKLAHAFLFTGPRGVGKTTCARILAKVINCENSIAKGVGEPCNQCESCLLFDSQASFNIIEMDAASNNSVEAMRNLVDQVRYQPQKGKYKVFIIDEVHMLSQAAFNAFLKTLEEPPAHVIFILATTERQKILPTILSRCQVYDFRRISNTEIMNQLFKVADEEKIEVNVDALHVIAQKADGSMRDALSIFDRIASFGDKEVSYAETINNLNVLDNEYYFTLINDILKEDTSNVLNTFKTIYQSGFDGHLFIDGLTEHIRQLLIAKSGSAKNLIDASQELVEKLVQQSTICNYNFLVDALSLVNECDIHFDKVRNKRLHVELLLVKLTYLNRESESSSQLQDIVKKKTNSIDEVSAIDKGISFNRIELEVFDQMEKEHKIADTYIQSESSVSKTEFSTPKFTSLKAIQKKAAQAIKSSSESAVELKIESFQAVWDNHLIATELPTLKTILSQAELSLERTKLEIRVGSNHSKNIIQLEHVLLEKLRKCVSDNRLEISIILDPEKAKLSEDKHAKRVLSNKEKFEMMRTTNPLVEDLIKSLKLKVDHGN